MESTTSADDFWKESKCSNISDPNIKAMNWIRVGIAIGGFGISTPILISVIIRREFKTTIERLFVYVLLATILRETALFSNIELQFQDEEKLDPVCSVLGAMDLYTAVLVLIFLASTIVYLLGRVVGSRCINQTSNAFAKSFELGFVIIVVLVPLIISAGLLYTDIFGFSIAWCWMQEYDNHCHKSERLKKILGGYSFLIIIGIVSVVLTAAIVFIYCRYVGKIRQAKDLAIQAIILIAILIVNTLIIIFSAVVFELRVLRTKALVIHYTYTVVMSLYDWVYVLGFYFTLKYQAFSTSVHIRARKSFDYASIPNVTTPKSSRISARSTTVPFPSLYTGNFTTMGED